MEHRAGGGLFLALVLLLLVALAVAPFVILRLLERKPSASGAAAIATPTPLVRFPTASPTEPPSAEPTATVPMPTSAWDATAAPGDPLRVDVGRYLDDVERARQEMVPSADHGVIASLTGYRRLVERLREMRPPDPCFRHRAMCLELQERRIEFLRRIQSAPAAEAQLFAAEEDEIRYRQEALVKETAALRRRYGL